RTRRDCNPRPFPHRKTPPCRQTRPAPGIHHQTPRRPRPIPRLTVRVWPALDSLGSCPFVVSSSSLESTHPSMKRFLLALAVVLLLAFFGLWSTHAQTPASTS